MQLVDDNRVRHDDARTAGLWSAPVANRTVTIPRTHSLRSILGYARDDRARACVLSWLLVIGAIGLLASCAPSSASAPSPVSTAAPSATVAAARATPTDTETATPAASPSRPTATPSESASPTPLPSPNASPGGSTVTSTPAGNVGYLEGRASIGPLTPVERVGVPSPTPSPQVCTARGLTIFTGDGQTQVTSFSLQPDCTYRVALTPGQYVVRLRAGGFGFSKDLPKTVQIEAGKTTHLDLHIDTGIR